eukprot:52027-Amphidinium_carterae.1
MSTYLMYSKSLHTVPAQNEPWESGVHSFQLECYTDFANQDCSSTICRAWVAQLYCTVTLESNA